MYVRFKKRTKQTNWSYDEKGTHKLQHPQTVKVYDAILVQSERVNGKPVQKFIDTLDSISEDAMKNEWQLYHFWVRARETLHEIMRIPGSWGLPDEFLSTEKAKELIKSMEKIIPAIPDDRMKELIRKEYSSFSEEGINKRITNYIDFLGHKLTKEELRKNSKIFEDFMKTLGRDPLSFNLETLTPNGIFCCIENNADETITVTGKASEWLDFLKQIQQYSPDSVVSN